MNVLQRLQGIREEIAYIRKDKKVETYMAVTHDQVTAETRDLFVKHGVMLIPFLVSSQMRESGGVTSKGNTIWRYEGTYDISFLNVDDPADGVTVRMEAHGNDTGDKAPGKTLSYAVKYAILKVLMIETGEQEESRVEGRRQEEQEEQPAVDREQLQKLIADQRAAMDSCDTRSSLKETAMKAVSAAVQAGDKEAEKDLRRHYQELAAKLPAEAKAA